MIRLGRGTGRWAAALAAVGVLSLLAAPVGARGEWVVLSPRDLLLNEALEVRVSVDYEVPTDLAEIIAFLNEAIAAKLDIRNALHLDPRIVSLNPRPVQIRLERARVRKVLALLLTDATTAEEENADDELGFVPYYQAGVIYISNRKRLRRLNMKRKEFRIYDVRDLLAAFPARGGGGGNDNNGGNNNND